MRRFPPRRMSSRCRSLAQGRARQIAVHLGAGDWITVDSCKDQTTGENSLLSYFDQIKVVPSQQVALLVGTHAHDDHVAGISEVYAAASRAQFVSSSALTSKEFFASVEADADIDEQLGQSVRGEYRRVLDEAKSRARKSPELIHLKRAIEQRELWKRTATTLVPSARVVALSPSDLAATRSLQLIAERGGQSWRSETARSGRPQRVCRRALG